LRVTPARELPRMWVRATPAYMTLVFRLRSDACSDVSIQCRVKAATVSLPVPGRLTALDPPANRGGDLGEMLGSSVCGEDRGEPTGARSRDRRDGN
jgi:hypothetical protein